MPARFRGNYGGELLQIIVGHGADHTNTDIPPHHSGHIHRWVSNARAGARFLAASHYRFCQDLAF
jgi:hypothetical protein